MEMAQTTVYQGYVYCGRDLCRGIAQYLSSFLDYFLDRNCKYLYRFKLWIRVHGKC